MKSGQNCEPKTTSFLYRGCGCEQPKTWATWNAGPNHGPEHKWFLDFPYRCHNGPSSDCNAGPNCRPCRWDVLPTSIHTEQRISYNDKKEKQMYLVKSHALIWVASLEKNHLSEIADQQYKVFKLKSHFEKTIVLLTIQIQDVKKLLSEWTAFLGFCHSSWISDISST